jgi:hypothetical protein
MQFYTPPVSSATTQQTAVVSQITCDRIEQYIQNIFGLSGGFVFVNNVFCTAVASNMNPTTISHNITAALGSDLSPIPTQVDINCLINLALREPKETALIRKLNALTGNPFPSTTAVAYSLTTQSVLDIGFNTYISQDKIYFNDKQQNVPSEKTITNTMRRYPIWYIGPVISSRER